MSFGVPKVGDFTDYFKQFRQQESSLPVDQSDCLHKACTLCRGTGRNAKGGHCIHAISCPCKNCSPFA